VELTRTLARVGSGRVSFESLPYLRRIRAHDGVKESL